VTIPANVRLISQENLPAAHPSSAAWSMASRVLVVSRDEKTGEQQQEMIRSLGYACAGTSDALSALRMIATDNSIGVVLIELKLGALDGLFLLNEISDRFSALRPIVTVAIGDQATDLTIDVMRSGASDLLERPLSMNALSDGLRRAVSRWTRQAQQFRAAAFAPEALERVVEAPVRSGFAAGDPSFADLQELGTRLIKSRQNRVNFVSESLLNEAAWGILLDLAVAGLKGERVATSSACASAQVPLSTALRHVNLLIKAGWVKRVGDPKDKRRTFIELQPHSFDLMVKYLRANWEVFAAKPSTDRTLSGHRHAA